MMYTISAPVVSLGCAVLLAAAVLTARAGQDPRRAASIYDFTMKDIDGREVPLAAYRGSVVLIVNVASRCGNTPQYRDLEQLYRLYRERGLVILAFPANDFGGQEPGDDAEIREFCTANYGVSFPLFSKISVKGEGMHPLYRYLTSDSTAFGGSVQWNFQKYLIDRKGATVAKFAPRTKPLAEEVTRAVEAALRED